jgi:hypothetical protein
MQHHSRFATDQPNSSPGCFLQQSGLVVVDVVVVGAQPMC